MDSRLYHVCEPEDQRRNLTKTVYDEQVSMMEMVLDVDDIVDEMNAYLRAGSRKLIIFC